MDQEPQVKLPGILRANRTINGKVWLAGVGPRPAPVMFVTAAPLEEEAATTERIGWNEVKRTPRMRACPPGIILQDIAGRKGIIMDDCFYVPVVRYLPDDPKHRARPTTSMLRECLPLLEADIREVKPEIIVCMGKAVFDLLSGVRAKESEVYGAWFYSEKYNAKIYYTLAPIQALHPDKHERFGVDFKAVKTMLDSMHGAAVEQQPVNGIVIHDSKELREFVQRMENENATLLSIDCEWHGHQHIDGKLRSLQIAWNATDAAYIRFMDDALNYVFDVPYLVAGAILARWLDRPEVKYIGHHLAVDLTWCAYWLGLQWRHKGVFDTEFCLQCCDESLDLGLDALALRYTTFGKYDWDLIAWKKANPGKADEGYGLIPDEILIPYGWKDVLTPMRAMPVIKKWMEDQDLMDYWNNVFGPMVIDVNAAFTLRGIPIDREKLDHMRRLYQWARFEMEKEFVKAMVSEATQLLRDKLKKFLPEGDAEEACDVFTAAVDAGGAPDAVRTLQRLVGAAAWPEVEPVVEHYLAAPEFNIRSKPQMVRWLFAVKGYLPIKSTQNKSAGQPSVSWEKVMTYPPEKQKQYIPATDTQTLETLAAKHKDKTIDLLLELNGIGNITKAFLKTSDTDDEGNVVKENGLHYWVTSQDTVALNHSTTETGRFRSWNPNCLNWPSWIHARLGAGMARIVKQRHEEGALPKEFAKYVGMKAKNFPTIRGVCMARDGWCIVEADFQTAEMRGLAYISGDEDLRRTIEEADPCFAKVKPESVPEGIDPEDCVCRLAYPDYITLPADKDKFLMTYSHDGEIAAKFTEDDLLKDAAGNIVHTKFDMHWKVAEMARKACRESMNKKRDRGAAKSTGFSNSYGGQAASIARKIEADTGVPQDESDIQDMLDAIAAGQPRATAFLKDVENSPQQGKSLRAASGRIRHCLTLADDIKGLSPRTREGQLTALGRECRNFYMQESVGAAAAVACRNLIDFSFDTGLTGYPAICLYDSVVVHCPFNERHIWLKALELYMFKANGWRYGDRILRYPVDAELNAGWSTKPGKELHDKLHDPEFEPTPEKLKNLENWLDLQLQLYTLTPALSVQNTREYTDA